MDILSIFYTVANLVTAVSYFWIPIQTFIYLNKARGGLDAINGELAEGVQITVLFIFACGVHHLLMSFHAPWAIQILSDLVMAFVSAQAAIRIGKFLKIIVPKN